MIHIFWVIRWKGQLEYELEYAPTTKMQDRSVAWPREKMLNGLASSEADEYILTSMWRCEWGMTEDAEQFSIAAWKSNCIKDIGSVRDKAVGRLVDE